MPISGQKIIKGFLSVEEKLQFDQVTDRLGMFQGIVIARIVLWWLDQPEEIQELIVRPRHGMGATLEPSP